MIQEFRSCIFGKLFSLVLTCLLSWDTSGRSTLYVRKPCSGPSEPVSEAYVFFGVPPSPSVAIVDLYVLMRFFWYPVSSREYREQEILRGHPGTEFNGNPRADASLDAPKSA